jgi:hypothetical protein
LGQGVHLPVDKLHSQLNPPHIPHPVGYSWGRDAIHFLGVVRIDKELAILEATTSSSSWTEEDMMVQSIWYDGAVDLICGVGSRRWFETTSLKDWDFFASPPRTFSWMMPPLLAVKERCKVRVLNEGLACKTFGLD